MRTDSLIDMLYFPQSIPTFVFEASGPAAQNLTIPSFWSYNANISAGVRGGSFGWLDGLALSDPEENRPRGHGYRVPGSGSETGTARGPQVPSRIRSQQLTRPAAVYA